MASLSPKLAHQLSAWRFAGMSIVFTNGVFDLLHPGHVKQLEAAASCGDALIVGLNSDASVKRQGKLGSRPIVDEVGRRIVLGALRCVDAVALFDEDTPLELIKLIKPDVLVKGADYVGKHVVGREVVENLGGKVELVPLVPGYSTTDIIRRIRS